MSTRETCLGLELGFPACQGPDLIMSADIRAAGIGKNACTGCSVPAYIDARQTIATLEVRERLLQDMAQRDYLTNLLNKRVFEGKLRQKIDANQPFALLILDLEDFSGVNGRLTHVGGDKVLKEYAEYLTAFFSDTLRRDDIIARIGGDEFGVILDNSRPAGEPINESNLTIIKQRLLEGYQRVPTVRGHNQKFPDNPLGMYIGSAIWRPGMSDEPDELRVLADPSKNKNQPEE